MTQSWWQKLFGVRAAPEAAPAASEAVRPLDDDAREEIRDWVRERVAAGYDDAEAIVIGATEVFEDEYDEEALRLLAAELTTDAIDAHAADSAIWPATTDCDRLDAAFAALEAEGVIARQNFTCCGTCGAYEIGDEIDAAIDQGRPAHGYTFFHMQDTESAVGGHGLYLNYGACAEGEEAAIAIGHRIVARLEAHGLAPEWDGSIGRRIAVPLDWKRRRTALTD
jgi:hypothetical protein